MGSEFSQGDESLGEVSFASNEENLPGLVTDELTAEHFVQKTVLN